MKLHMAVAFFAWLLTACAPLVSTAGARMPVQLAKPGERLVVYIPSEGIGMIAVQVTLPQSARYSEGAGVVVEVQTFATLGNGLASTNDFSSLGLIHLTYLNPGQISNGISSEGTNDYGGPLSIQVLRDVIRYASGETADRDGYRLSERSMVKPLSGELGLFAFSHPGIAAVNVLALYGNQIQVQYLVGRENPTADTLTAVEAGYWDEQNHAVLNPLYRYPQNYTAKSLDVDYSTIRWDGFYRDNQSIGRPYFDLNKNGKRDESDFVLGSRIPTMFGKRVYSAALTRALADNGALSLANWPADLATPSESAEWWQYRSSTERYVALATMEPNLKTMLVFNQHDHVQPAADKPHIHQAYSGLRAAALWVRLNPDSAYLTLYNPKLAASYTEHTANSEPSNWLDVEKWAYPNLAGADQIASLAAVAEMADRMHFNQWVANLDQVLSSYPVPQKPTK